MQQVQTQNGIETAADKRSDFSASYKTWLMIVLTLVYAFNFVDRIVVSVVGQAMKTDLGLSDLQLGLLGGLAFSLFYSCLGIPVARLAEHSNRVRLLAVCVGLWSVLTAALGIAQSYVQLLFLRMGVGIGEAGGTPTSHSLIADHFSPAKRATALAILAWGPPIGGMAAAFAGGYLAQTIGWRHAFIVVGLPGLAVALLAWLTLREPPHGLSDRLAGIRSEATHAPPLRDVLKFARTNPIFRNLILGTAVESFATYSINLFLPVYLARVYHMGLAQAGLTFGLIIGLGGLIGNTLGGTLADRLGIADRRWYAWISALGFVLAGSAAMLGFLQADWHYGVAAFFVYAVLSNFWYGPTFSLIHGMVDARMRASCTAVVFLLMNLMGQGIGMTVVGGLSDVLAGRSFGGGDYHQLCIAGQAALKADPDLAAACGQASADGIRGAMALAALALFASVFFYLRAARGVGRSR